jgi:hypothetical protein
VGGEEVLRAGVAVIELPIDGNSARTVTTTVL